MSNYYYIISSLPELKLDVRLSEDSLDEAWTLIQRNSSEKDLAQIDWFLRRNDLYNLLESWQQRFLNHSPRPFRKPYSISIKEMEASEKDVELLPPLFREFYLAHEAELRQWTANEMDSAWFAYFFSQASEKASPFVSELLAFEREVRRLMATFNTGVYPFVNKELRYGSGTLFRQLLKGKSQLNEKQKLSQPFLEPLLKALASKDPQAIINAVHVVLWNKADDLAKGQHFDQIALLNYCFKLFLIYRREQLSANEQKPLLQDLLEESLINIKAHD